MWVAYNRARFPATRPRVFCELKMMKIVILIYQIMQEKFAYSELFGGSPLVRRSANPKVR